MRVVAVCLPAPGHLNPLLPLLGALAARGDEVVVASGADVADRVHDAGLPLHAAGAGFGEWFEALRARTRGTPGQGLPPGRIAHYFLPRLFAEIAAGDMIDDVTAAARALAPDFILFESSAFAAPLAATMSGVPAVCLQVGFLPAPEVADLVADAVAPLWAYAEQRIDRRRAVYGDLLLRTAPPTLETVDPRVPALELQPAPAPASAAVPGAPPLVHVTFGTTSHHDLDALRCIVEALADEPVRVVATIGSDEHPPWLDAVPTNAAVHRYLPHQQLLPRCAVVIHHGGAGTMYATLAHALPQVIVPTGADQFDNAARLRRAGLAHTLHSDALAPDAIRAAVRAALHDDEMRARAATLAAEIRAMPDASAVAQELRLRFDRSAPVGLGPSAPLATDVAG